MLIVVDRAQQDSPSVLNRVALDALRRHGGKRSQQAITLLAAGQLAAPLAKWGWKRARAREDYTISVAGVDDIYPDLHEWVLERIPENDRKALIATTHRDRSTKLVECDSPAARPAPGPMLRLRYDGSRTQSVLIDGHRVEVEVKREDIPGGRERLPENWRALTETIKFTVKSADGRDTVTRMIDGLLAAKYAEAGPPPLLIPSRWGGSWNRRSDLPPRTLDSIVLKDGQLEVLVADLGTFLAAEGEYARTHQPWHRGYLFHGAPGTGKTSVARALANHFELPVYYLPLGDLDKDADLMNLVGGIEPRSVLLLEDADVYQAATSRKKNDRTSVAALLNALDGVWTPHGLVTILTTNNRDALDDALIREGRIDVDEEFTVLDVAQAEALAEWITGTQRSRLAREYAGRSPAALIGALRDTREVRGEAVCDGDGGLGGGVRDHLADREPAVAPIR